jgi:acetyltransferase
MAEAIIDAWNPYKHEKALMACMMVRKQEARGAIDLFYQHGVPVYDYPESASLAMSYLTKYSQIRKRFSRKPKPVSLSVYRSKAEEVISSSLESQSDAIMSSAEVIELLEAYGIPYVESTKASSLQEAVKAAEVIGYPVVMKVDVADIHHKTDIKGVILDIRNKEELLAAFGRLDDVIVEHSAAKPSFVIQRMLQKGREFIIGVTRDSIFGPMIMCGLGGVFVDVIRDVNFKLPPLSVLDAQQMLESLKVYKLLTGVRGEERVNIELLAEVILRVSKMAENHPELIELDLNPIFISPAGHPSRVVDARVRVARTFGKP